VALVAISGVSGLLLRGVPTIDSLRKFAVRGEPVSVESDELARQVVALFEDRCHRCHGQGGSDEGGFNFVLSLDKLAEENAYVTAGNPEESYLFTRVSEGEMPPAGEGEPLSEAELALVRSWIAAGATGVEQTDARQFVSTDDIFRAIRTDLLRNTPQEDRAFSRYYTLTHLYNAGLSQDELETYRLALAKLLNSLSWNDTLAVPKPVDPEGTILKVDLRDLDWTSANWDLVLSTDPYAVVSTSEAAQSCSEVTGCQVPMIRGDWFVARASKPPLYYQLLDLPDTLDGLQSRIPVDSRQNIASGKVVRVGFVESGVSDNNRMFERHETPFGGLWISYDFASSVGRKNVLQHPLGPGGEEGFEHDGGEIIFSLPNGLQGYLLVDAQGRRIDKGPIEIVADDRQPDRSVVAGISCMTCHANGMIRKQDEVRPTVLANRQAFRDAETILTQYPEASVIERALNEDEERFTAAMKQLGLDRLTATGEPIFHMAKRFDQAVDKDLAAAEFGVRPDELVDLIDNFPSLGRALGVLKLANGKVKREQFLAEFGSAAEALGLGRRANSPSPFSPATPQSPAVAATAPAVSSSPAVAAQTPPAPPSASLPAQTAATPAGPSSPQVAVAAAPVTPATPGPPVVPGSATVQAPAPLPAAATSPIPTEQPSDPFTPPAAAALPPEAFIREWHDKDGNSLFQARFDGMSYRGNVRLSLLPRTWTLGGDYEQPFEGTFWVFYSRPGLRGVQVRIGDVDLPGYTLNFVDIPRDRFSAADATYLDHLESLQDYAVVQKGRIRYYEFPPESLSATDLQYVFDLLDKLPAPPDPLLQPPSPGPAGPEEAGRTSPPGDVPPNSAVPAVPAASGGAPQPGAGLPPGAGSSPPVPAPAP
jgi:mono/diheme cytochrome c family protein